MRNFLADQAHSHISTNCITCEISVTLTQTLIINMKYSNSKNFSLTHLKQALQLKQNLEPNNDFGCALETFETILEVLHTETEKNSDCKDKCVSHKYFGLEFYEEMYKLIRTCCRVMDKSQNFFSYFLRIYAKDLESFYNYGKFPKFEDLVGSCLKFCDVQGLCKTCGQVSLCVRKWASAPVILAISFVWGLKDYNFSRQLLRSISGKLSLLVESGPETYSQEYVLKGIICYKENHYCCYFYYPETKCWYILDDTYTRKLNNWSHVVRNMMQYSGIPAILFYQQSEKQSTIMETDSFDLTDMNCSNCDII